MINWREESNKQKECYCNRTDCSGRIKNSRKYDSLYQKYNKQLDNWNKLKECIKECLEAIDTIQKLTGNAIENYTPRILTYRQILDKMHELERSDSNE